MMRGSGKRPVRVTVESRSETVKPGDYKNIVPVSYDPFRVVGELERAEAIDAKARELLQHYRDNRHGLSLCSKGYRLDFAARLDTERLAKALQQLSRDQESLRSIYSADHNSVMICKLDLIELRMRDLSHLPMEQVASNVKDLSLELISTPFDIYNGPLLRVLLLHTSMDASLLLLSSHDLVTINTSLLSLLERLGIFYAELNSSASSRSQAMAVGYHPSSVDVSSLQSSWPVALRSIDRLRHANPEPEDALTPDQLAWIEVLRQMWLEVLPCDNIDLDDNFFALGGQSLQAATVLTRLQKQYHVKLSLREFLLTPSLRALGAQLQAMATAPKNADSSQPVVEGRALGQSMMFCRREFVRKELSGPFETLEFPTDYPRNSDIQAAMNQIRCELQLDEAGCVRLWLPNPSSEDWQTYFLTLYLALVSRYSGQSQLCCLCARDEPKLSLPLSFQIDRESTLQKLWESVHSKWSTWSHAGAVDVAAILQELNVTAEPARSALYSIQFSCLTSEEQLTTTYQSAPVDLHLKMIRKSNSITFELEYRQDLFDRATMQSFLTAFEHLCKLEGEQRETPLAELALLSDQAHQKLVYAHNQTLKVYKGPQYLHELIDQTAERLPDAIAVHFHQRQLSYKELVARANQCAHFLIDQGVGPGDIVGLSLHRSPEMIIAMLAILKAGAAYMPMDPDYPGERLEYMLENSSARYVLSEQDVSLALRNQSVSYLFLDASKAEIAAKPSTAPQSMTVTAESLAYVIYTSGSTGKPKGVAIPHRAVVNFLHAMEDAISIRASDRLLAVTTISFDISILEIFLTLKVGARLTLMSQEEAMDGEILQEAVGRHNITMMQATPATWRLMLDSGWQGKPDLTVICGGEAFPRDLARRLVPRVAKVWNAYGPTEATVWASIFQITDPEKPILIGKPMANYKTYILNESLQALPQGMVGNLYLGGASLAQGYLHRQDLTDERFIDNPFEPGERIYDTGDLARYRSDMHLEYLSRRDHQVKIRGYRIELGEIEAAASQLPMVQQAVVMVREDEPGDKRLVCYVVLKSGQDLEKSEFDRQLALTLPEYMRPKHLVCLETIPLTASGKVDRKALPKPTGQKSSAFDDDEAPTSERELQIATIWQALLGVDYVSVHDNFFDLGGHSLLAIKAVKAMAKLSAKPLGMRDLLTNNLGQLAALLADD